MVKYTVEKSRYENNYILWKTVSSERGICSRNIFRGSRKDCYEKKKEILEEKK